MKKSNYQNQETELDIKSILIQLAFGFAAGIALILVCGFAECVHDLICK